MALKIYLKGVTAILEKGSITWTLPAKDLQFQITSGTLSIVKDGKFIVSEVSSDIQDIGGSTLSNDTAVIAYLSQFIGSDSVNGGSNATLTVIASVLTTSTLLLAANEHRQSAIIKSDSTAILYIKFGINAAATSHTYEVAGGTLAPTIITDYKGAIYGFWAAANGDAKVTEIHI